MSSAIGMNLAATPASDPPPNANGNAGQHGEDEDEAAATTATTGNSASAAAIATFRLLQQQHQQQRKQKVNDSEQKEMMEDDQEMPDEDEDEDDQDQLLSHPPPPLEDDDDDDNEEESSSSCKPASKVVLSAEEDNTYGSPGLREAFQDDDEDEEEEKSSSSRRNKRKNFKPRNIVYNEDDEASAAAAAAVNNEEAEAHSNGLAEDNEDESSPLNLSGDSSPLPARKTLMPRRLEDTSTSSSMPAASTPMDLSVSPSSQQQDVKSLSVVKPEVLFGKDGKQEEETSSSSSASNPFAALPFPPLLAAAAAMGAGGTTPASGPDGVREAFQELLVKIYGIPAEIAETIIKNAQSAQAKLQQNNNNDSTANNGGGGGNGNNTSASASTFSTPTAPPGMLSAALLGAAAATPPAAAAASSSPTSHPPTPPRTPKTPSSSDLMFPRTAGSNGPSDLKLPTVPNMPPVTAGSSPNPLLSLASIQDQVIGKSSQPNILAAQLNKPLGQMGLPPGLLHPGLHPPLPGPASGIPPHILAAQRAGMLPGVHKSPTDYTRYFKRFSSSLECGSLYCKDMNYREHFHCTVAMCREKVFAKKEEMIRHSKWHQKMDDAFKYGFRRVTPMDDCSDQFPDCQHNKKQTHYHCITTKNCDKCYISTSDVQMHFNYHRKDNLIQREGFLRFRGVEDCETDYCPFRTQKTTHFHCNRGGCNFTFKNKADMEKHKNFHMKDEQLNKDGFRKFMKHDNCGFASCRFSKTVNHIHCIRSGCDYVLHSSGQLYSHKRKHERDDLNGEGGDRPPSSENGSITGSDTSSTPPLFKQEPAASHPLSLASLLQQQQQQQQQPNNKTAPFPPFGLQPLPLTPSALQQHPGLQLSDLLREKVPDDAWRNYTLHFDSGEGCGFQGCELDDLEHYHCKDEGCETVFRREDDAREHGRNHFLQEHISESFFSKSDPDENDRKNDGCPDGCLHKGNVIHYHCKWENCGDVIMGSDSPFKRLDHYKLHEYAKKWNLSGSAVNSLPASLAKDPVSMTLTTSIDAMFKRKRGRPPKNRVIELPGSSGLHPSGDFAASPQAVFTSFKLPKPGLAGQPDFSGALPLTPPKIGSFSLQSTAAAATSPGSTSSTKMTAPLGGLPAMTQQIAPGNINIPPSITSPELKAENNSNAEQKTPTKSESGKEPLNSDDSPPKSQGLIKAKGTYYPLTAFPTNMPQGAVMRKDEEESSPGKSDTSSSAPLSNSGDETSPTISMKSKMGVNFLVSCARQGQGETENALAKLLQASQDMQQQQQQQQQQQSVSSTPLDQTTAKIASQVPRGGPDLADHPVYGPEPQEESCGRPFCKLKRRAHYHCNFCNQGFTEKEKLEPHLKRHTAENSSSSATTPPIPNLASLLRDGIPKEPLPLSEATRRTPSVDSQASNNSSSTGGKPDNPGNSQQPNSLPFTLGNLTPTSSIGPLSAAQSLSSPPTTTTSAAALANSLFLPTSFNSQLAGLVRGNPFASNPLLPPGMPPFFPPGMLGIPGLSNPFAGRPPVPSYDPTKHPLTRMPDPANMGQKRSSPLSQLLMDSDLDSLPPGEKKLRLQSSMRMLKDEPVPEGYMRFRFNEDCGFMCCNYREHQTHFHCMRKDCNYRFCDKTRFVQHTARHERLDTLCGQEFVGFRGVPCGRDTCELNVINNRAPSITGEPAKSSSHFHCLKCDYYCTDTNKVVAHRRQHQKMDSISSAGFEKYTPTQECSSSACPHNGKQTHYHCRKCQYAVLGLSQMEAHKFRHVNEMNE